MLAALSDPGGVLIVVNDPSRPTRTRPVLRVLARLARKAERCGPVRVLVATGTHRFEAARRASFEEAVLGDCGLPISQVAWHDARRGRGLAEAGGLRVHRLLAAARAVVVIGSIEPHYFAGVTGPHKTLTIGCLEHARIERNHALALRAGAAPFRLRGNPVFEDIMAMVRRVDDGRRRIVAVGHVLSGSRLVAAAAGGVGSVLEALVPVARRLAEHVVASPVDVLRLRVPPPLGESLYQADKAIKNNEGAVRDGGVVLLEAPCGEGIGPRAFVDLWCGAGSYQAALARVRRRGYRLGDHKALRLLSLSDPLRRGVRVAIVSRGLREALVEGSGGARPARAPALPVPVFGTVAAALRWAAGAASVRLRRGLVIEDAGHLVVTPAGAPQARE